MTGRLEEPEIISVRCDVHSWMQGWIVVLASPSFSITDGSGLTRIEGVPAGRHLIQVWHPELGKQAKPVDVEVGQVATMTFGFRA